MGSGCQRYPMGPVGGDASEEEACSDPSGVRTSRRLALKHRKYLESCKDQPCPDMETFRAGRCSAYRFMSRPATEKDFDPPAILDGPKARDKCGRFALSFFETLEFAQNRFASLADRVDAALRYGDHIGLIDIVETDGVLSSPNKRGHINLHPEEGVLFAHRIRSYHPMQDRREQTGGAARQASDDAS